MRISPFWSLAAVASTSLATSGCGKNIPDGFPSPGSSKTLSLPDSNRSYRIHIPANYEKNTQTQVYFSFCGAGKDGDEQEGLSQFSNPEFNPNGIAVYPNTENGVWLSNQLANTSHPNDLDFTNDLLTHLEKNLCVDRSRIYANGKSNGGELAAVIACNATVGSRFAAFSVVSGAWHETGDISGVGACEPAMRPEGYPFLIFHGTVDQTAPIDGDTEDEIVPIIDVLHDWAERNGCPKDEKWARNVTVSDHPLVKHAGWDCDGKKNIVQFYREGDNGHCWPSTHSNDDYRTLGREKCPIGHYVFNATEIIFDFYSQHQLNI
jgi:poly(3-hydroxybutyrate) depolymerase